MYFYPETTISRFLELTREIKKFIYKFISDILLLNIISANPKN